MNRYQIVTGTRGEVVEWVEKYMEDGYVPQGGLIVTGQNVRHPKDGNVLCIEFAQALVLIEDAK